MSVDVSAGAACEILHPALGGVEKQYGVPTGDFWTREQDPAVLIGAHQISVRLHVLNNRWFTRSLYLEP